jgi:hypothetical protein
MMGKVEREKEKNRKLNRNTLKYLVKYGREEKR